MRISDWSSDVCSSDLCRDRRAEGRNRRAQGRTRQEITGAALPPPKAQKTGQMIKHALSVTRQADFAAWYQAVIAEAKLAKESGVRGCMVIKPRGYGIWDRIQAVMDAALQDAGVTKAYFTRCIPLNFFARDEIGR